MRALEHFSAFQNEVVTRFQVVPNLTPNSTHNEQDDDNVERGSAFVDKQHYRALIVSYIHPDDE